MSVRFRLSVSRLFDRVSVSVDLLIVSVCDRVEITKMNPPRTPFRPVDTISQGADPSAMHSMWKQWLCGVSSLDKDEGTSCANRQQGLPLSRLAIGLTTQLSVTSMLLLLRKLQAGLSGGHREPSGQQPTRQPK